MDTKAITVTQLNNYIKQIFDAEELLHYIEVVGEVDGMSIRQNAVYFSLKDKESVISCVCYYLQKMKGIENGANVIVRGTVGYWNKAGRVSFVISHCESFGFGQLFLQFETLKKKLEAEGFFDVGVKKQLPPQVRRIGVVTSKSGAVLHDIKSVVRRRDPLVDIVVYPTCVQGFGAAEEITTGINFLASLVSDTKSKSAALDLEDISIKPVDIIIVARGGGSKEDLAAFNSESVARAVFASKIPVISAIGHETDWTLIDFVADLRAATPSAAAELAIPEAVSERDVVIRAYKHIYYTLRNKYQTRIAQVRALWAVLRSAILHKLKDKEDKILGYLNVFEASNPLTVLRRGYAKIYHSSHEVISVDDVTVGDSVDIKLYNGTIGATVTGKTALDRADTR